MKNKPITINLHLTNSCNMSCKGCYSHLKFSRNMDKNSWITIISNIANDLKHVSQKKINFVGGEPTLLTFLPELVIHAKNVGFTTSIVTNGSKITSSYLQNFKNSLDWIGISVDSMDKSTNYDIGRAFNNGKFVDYERVCRDVNNSGINLKINTVVSQYNKDQDFFNLFLGIHAKRWKVFQFLPIHGENDVYSDDFLISKDQFDHFNKINSTMRMLTEVIYENNNDMLQSYIMIDPQGRPFSNKNNNLSFGKTLLENKLIPQAIELGFDYNKFEQRGGIYEWESTTKMIFTKLMNQS